MFHTGDTPGICFACPGTVPIEVTHFVATVIDVELALRARRRVLATTRVDPEFLMRINLSVLNVADGNFSIFIIYAGVVVKICLLTQAEETGDSPPL
jgi:hypothetical protein